MGSWGIEGCQTAAPMMAWRFKHLSNDFGRRGKWGGVSLSVTITPNQQDQSWFPGAGRKAGIWGESFICASLYIEINSFQPRWQNKTVNMVAFGLWFSLIFTCYKIQYDMTSDPWQCSENKRLQVTIRQSGERRQANSFFTATPSSNWNIFLLDVKTQCCRGNNMTMTHGPRGTITLCFR